MIFDPPIGEQPSIEWIEAEFLNVDHAYQRMIEGPASKRLIEKIAKHWDWRLCGPLTVSNRCPEDDDEWDDQTHGFFVIDGQHRLEAAKTRGDITHLPCMVSQFGNQEDEALLFVSLNSTRRQISQLDRFHARVAAKEPLAVSIKELIESCGATIPRYLDVAFWKPGDISFPDLVGAKISEWGSGEVETTIHLLLAAYPDKVLKQGKPLFEGLVYFVAKSGVDAFEIEEMLKTKRQLEWIMARDKHRAMMEIERPDQAMAEIFAAALNLDLPKDGRALGQRRFGTKAPGHGVDLKVNHPAVKEGRTLFPSTVREVGDEKVFKSGHNSSKIGSKVEKGAWKGFPIYTLTLEERASCPDTCKLLLSCYGNNMHLAHRFKHGPELEAEIWQELEGLSEEYPAGFVIRLHVLGDFYSLEYVQLWAKALDAFPALRVFGYTAHDPDGEIGAELLGMAVEQWERFAMRFSGNDLQEMAALVIDPPETICPDNAFICPAQTMKTACCATCAACWSSEKNVAFLKH